MRTVAVMIGEQGLVNESLPEKSYFWVEFWSKDNKVRRGGAFQAEDTVYAKVLCQEGAQSVKELKERQNGSNTKSMREKTETWLGGKQKLDQAGP